MSLLVERQRVRRILGLGLPIMAGSSTWVILGLADMIFVGFFGTAALGAVGLGAFISQIFLSLFWGVSIAVQATVARRKGEGRTDDLAAQPNTAIVLVLIVAPLPTIVLYLLAPTIFGLMNSDPEVLAHGIDYLGWLVLSATFVGVSSAFSGFWNAIDRPTLFMRVVLFTTLMNVPLNYVFMFGLLGVPAFGVEGAGIGTFAASVLAFAYNFLLGFKHARGYGFLRVRPSLAQARVLLRLAIPGGMQQVLEMFALTLMYRIVGTIGTLELASYTVLVNLIGAVGLPAWGLGTAGATLVGQALGKRDKDDAARWAWDVIKVGCATIAVLGAPLWIAPELVLSAFIHDAETIEMARLPCRILGLMIVINAVGYMLASMLNGAGDVKRVMYVNLAMQYFVLLPGAYLGGSVLGFGLLGIWIVHQFAFRGGQSVIFAMMWRAGRWSRIAI